MECCFCGKPLSTSVPGGQGVKVPDYCRACGTKYTQELGAGWDRQPWAVDYFQAHRRLMYVEQKEASWVKLDQPTGWDKDGTTGSMERLGDTVDAATVDQSPGRPGATPGDVVLDGLILEMKAQGLGGNRIHKQLQSMGWSLSQRAVYYRLAQARKATTRAMDGTVVQVEAVDPATGDSVELGPQAEVYVQKVY